MATDFEAGLWSIQILSECCSGYGACYASQKASNINRNDGNVWRKPLKSFSGFEAEEMHRVHKIRRPDRQKQQSNLDQSNSLPKMYMLPLQRDQFVHFEFVESHT